MRGNLPHYSEDIRFLVVEVPGVHKSTSSYEPYVIQEMSLEEGRDELVTKIKMFIVKDFTKIYKAIWGHMGSYMKGCGT